MATEHKTDSSESEGGGVGGATRSGAGVPGLGSDEDVGVLCASIAALENAIRHLVRAAASVWQTGVADWCGRLVWQ